MLYVLTALKCEAAALAGLPGKHIVTGVGSSALKALEKIEIGPSDHVINIGVCAGTMPGCYLVNSVTDEKTGRRYYPDMMRDPVLPEASLITSQAIVTDPAPGVLYDMEASLICEYVMRKTAPSKIALIKAVSDDGSRIPSANEVTGILRQYREKIRVILEEHDVDEAPADYMPVPASVMDELKLTQYMRHEFEDLVHYAVLSGKMELLDSILDEMRENGVLPASDKRQGRRALDEIFARLR